MKLTRDSEGLFVFTLYKDKLQAAQLGSTHSSQRDVSFQHVLHPLHSGRKYKVDTNAPSSAKKRFSFTFSKGI